MPEHTGHAPNGELKEKDRGSSSSVVDRVLVGAAIFSLNRKLAARVLGVEVDEVEDHQAPAS
jgi:hypothetical protein